MTSAMGSTGILANVAVPMTDYVERAGMVMINSYNR
jgi:hypothetical protein